MNNQLRHTLDWLAVFAWMGLIYYFSNQPDLKSALAPTWDHVLRKGAHFLEYFTLCYLLYRAIRGHGIPLVPSLLICVLAAVGYAISDEWHQGWVSGRTSSPIDASIDTLGVLACAVLLFRRNRDYR